MRLIRILLMVLVVVVLGAIGLVLALPGEKIARLAADQVRAQTGRALTFEGDVGISWYPVFGVSTGPVRLSNAQWSDAGPMFTAESAAIGVDVLSALRGNIRITKVEAVAPQILLERSADGKANWELFPPTDAPARGGSSGGRVKSLSLEVLSIEGAGLRYVDHGGDSFALRDVDVELRWPDLDQPAEVGVTLRPAGKAVTAAATVGQLRALLAGEVSSVMAKVSAPGGTVEFEGRIGIRPEAAGRVEADLSDMAAFAAAIGFPGAPKGPARFKGDVTVTGDGRISLRDGSVTALGNMLKAEVDVTPGSARPMVTANIVAGRLDLGALSGGSDGGATEPASSGWSKTPIDVSALGLMDGRIDFAAETVDFGGLVAQQARGNVTIENARAVFTLTQLTAYEGAVTGSLVANNRSGLSVRGDLKILQVALKKALGAAAGLDRFTGKADLDMDFLGTGASVHDIMQSLGGKGQVAVGRGTIEGIDLDRLFRGDPTGGTTVFDRMGASWVIENGVLRNDDLLMELPRVIAKGAGTVGLGQRQIKYRLTPQLRREDGNGLAVPVKIEGSWDNPRIAPDMDAVLKQNLAQERKALEEDARKRLEQELGIEKQEGQSTEDAVRKKLEDEARKGLLNLLGNN